MENKTIKKNKSHCCVFQSYFSHYISICIVLLHFGGYLICAKLCEQKVAQARERATE